MGNSFSPARAILVWDGEYFCGFRLRMAAHEDDEFSPPSRCWSFAYAAAHSKQSTSGQTQMPNQWLEIPGALLDWHRVVAPQWAPCRHQKPPKTACIDPCKYGALVVSPWLASHVAAAIKHGL